MERLLEEKWKMLTRSMPQGFIKQEMAAEYRKIFFIGALSYHRIVKEQAIKAQDHPELAQSVHDHITEELREFHQSMESEYNG